MSALQAYFIAILQGATELFPISSLGHAVVVPALLGWSLDQRAPQYLPFLVLLHTGTATALTAYFWRDWTGLLLGVIGQGGPVRVREARRMTLLIVVATIPAVIVGGLLAGFFRTLFANPLAASVFLALNGLVLIAGEKLRGRESQAGAKPLLHLTVQDAVFIGVCQIGALFPGISRAVRHHGRRPAARARPREFRPFLIPDRDAHHHRRHRVRGAATCSAPRCRRACSSKPPSAAVLAGITAWLSTAFLMRYFRRHDSWALNPFAFYCLAFGAGSALMFLVRG